MDNTKGNESGAEEVVVKPESPGENENPVENEDVSPNSNTNSDDGDSPLPFTPIPDDPEQIPEIVGRTKAPQAEPGKARKIPFKQRINAFLPRILAVIVLLCCAFYFGYEKYFPSKNDNASSTYIDKTISDSGSLYNEVKRLKLSEYQVDSVLRDATTLLDNKAQYDCDSITALELDALDGNVLISCINKSGKKQAYKSHLPDDKEPAVMDMNTKYLGIKK